MMTFDRAKNKPLSKKNDHITASLKINKEHHGKQIV